MTNVLKCTICEGTGRVGCAQTTGGEADRPSHPEETDATSFTVEISWA